MKKSRLLSFLFFLILFQGCDLFEYHPYDGRISGEKNINKKNIARIEAVCAGKDTIRFVLMGDSQGWLDETEKFVRNVNNRNDIDFVIHGGDLADFGLTKEFMWKRDIMNKLKVPYVAITGNHDCLGSGEYVFREIFGELNFSFTAGKTKFVCLNTNALEYDYSRPVPDFTFLEEELENIPEEVDKTVIAMHVPPFSSIFNNNVAKIFQNEIKRFPDLQFCLHAHEHRFMSKDLFEDGIIYYGCDSMGKRGYIIFTITPDGYDYEVVQF